MTETETCKSCGATPDPDRCPFKPGICPHKEFDGPPMTGPEVMSEQLRDLQNKVALKDEINAELRNENGRIRDENARLREENKRIQGIREGLEDDIATLRAAMAAVDLSE